MTYEVELRMTAYVSVEYGGEDAARELARDKINSGPASYVAEGLSKTAGRYVVKALGAEVNIVRPWIGNRRIVKEGT